MVYRVVFFFPCGKMFRRDFLSQNAIINFILGFVEVIVNLLIILESLYF